MHWASPLINNHKENITATGHNWKKYNMSNTFSVRSILINFIIHYTNVIVIILNFTFKNSQIVQCDSNYTVAQNKHLNVTPLTLHCHIETIKMSHFWLIPRLKVPLSYILFSKPLCQITSYAYCNFRLKIIKYSLRRWHLNKL